MTISDETHLSAFNLSQVLMTCDLRRQTSVTVLFFFYGSN